MIASRSLRIEKNRNALSTQTAIPWDMLAAPLAVAEDAVARLDERLRNSPVREGWIARTHFSDACASFD